MKKLLLDTGVLIADLIPPDRTTSISAITLAELEHGLVASVRQGGEEVLRRAQRLERIRAIWGEGLPFTGDVAPAYGRIVAAELALGRRPGARTADLFIAAIALHHDAALATTNPADFAALVGLIEVVSVV